MPYWDDRAAAAANLHLFVPGSGWRPYADKLAADGKAVEQQGSARLIQSAFLNALNATNLVVLTGAGSSFGATNVAPKMAAPGMSDLWTCVQEAVGMDRFAAACAAFPSAPINENIERLLTLCKIYLELNETAGDAAFNAMASFIKDAEKAILRRVDFVDASTSLSAHSAIVQKIGRRGIRKSRTKLFTTNYDLCFEEAARRQKFVVIDGFSHTLDQTYDRSHFDYDVVRRRASDDTTDYIENVFHLYKLHGSFDWRRIDGEIRRLRDDVGEPVLIYPRSSKYQEAFEAPYLDMMGALQASLREPDTALIVSGFGFNDDHISRPILSAVEANLSLRLIICDPVFISEPARAFGGYEVAVEAPNNKFLATFLRLAERGDSRIHLMTGRFDDMATALPDLIGETDRERHTMRVRSLNDPAQVSS